MTDCTVTQVPLGKRIIGLVDCDPNKGAISPQSPDDAVYVNSNNVVVRQSPAEFFKSVGLNPDLPYSTAKLQRLLGKLHDIVQILDPGDHDYFIDGRGNPISFHAQLNAFRVICQDTSDYWQSRYQPELCPQTTGALLASLIPPAEAKAWAEAHVASVEEALAPYFRLSEAEVVAFRLSHMENHPQTNLADNMTQALSAAAYLYPLAGLPAAERLASTQLQWDHYARATTAWEAEVVRDIGHLAEVHVKAWSAITSLPPNEPCRLEFFLERQATLQKDYGAAKAAVAAYQVTLDLFRQKHPALVRQFDVWDKTDYWKCSSGSRFGGEGSCSFNSPNPLYTNYYFARGLNNPSHDIANLSKKPWVLECDTNGPGDGCPWWGDTIELPPLISLVTPGTVR